MMDLQAVGFFGVDDAFFDAFDAADAVVFA
jgi:hypothetical protein